MQGTGIVDVHCVREKRDRNDFVVSSENWGDFDEIWCVVSRINLLQNHVNIFHLKYHNPCLPFAGFESINAGKNVGSSLDVDCGCCGHCWR